MSCRVPSWVIFCSGLFVACGGGGGGGGFAADAAPQGCDPVSQSGCGANEKCAQLDISEDISVVDCVPDGSVGAGGECVLGDFGVETGYDNCQAGNTCVYDACREICTRAGVGGDVEQGTCGDLANGLPGVCTQFEGLFDASVGVGACFERCTLPAGDDCSEPGTACTDTATIVFDGADELYGEFYASCAAYLFDEAPAQVGDPCGGQDCDCGIPGDDENPCFTNWCAAGFSSHGAGNGSLAEYRTLDVDDSLNLTFTYLPSCTKYCAPHVDFLAGNNNEVANAVGDSAAGPVCDPGYECRYLGGFDDNYLQFGSESLVVPPEVGICVKSGLWGTCGRDVPGAIDPRDYWRATLYADPENPELGAIDVTAINNYVPGCYSYSDMLDAYFEVTAATFR